MKKIFSILICFFICISNSYSQIDSLSIQGIDCYNDTGYIKIDLANTSYILESDEWEYQPYDDTAWYLIDTSSLYYINPTNDTIFTTQCGKHRVTVFDQITFSFNEYIFFIPCPVTVGLGQEQKIKCFGDSSGILIAPTYGGIVFDPDSSTFDSLGFYSPNDTTGDEYYTYQWFSSSNLLGANLTPIGDSTNTLENVSAGFYNVVVTDAIGCRDTLDFRRINNPYPLAIDSVKTTDISCNGGQDGSIMLVVNGGRKFHSTRNYFYYILDSNNDTIYRSDDLVISSNFSQLALLSDSSLIVDSILFDNLSIGTYNIVVEDSFGCLIDTSFTLTEPQPFEVFTTELTPLLCITDSIWFFIDSVTGGQGTQNYYWLESSSMSDSLLVGEGDYDVIIEDTLYGCYDTISVHCEADFEIFINETVNNALCYGEPTGSISIDTIYGANEPYNYQWGGNVGQNTFADSLYAGNYFLLIQDSIGCSQYFYFDVDQNDAIFVNSSLTSPSCNGLSDGVIHVNVNGGQSPYSLNWSNGTGISDSLFGLSSGSYTLNVTDDNLCEYSTTITLSEPDSLLLYFNNYENPLDCYGGLTPISAIISGGTGPFNFLWSNGATTSQTVIGAGLWSCDVTDNNGCTVSESVSITQPDEFYISDSASNNPLCTDGGSASIQTSGGTPPISYLWSTGETTQSISNILVNTCWVIATDSCGNTDSVGFDLLPYDLVTSVSYNDTNHISTVEIDPISTGSSFLHEWFDINGTLVATNSSVTNLCQGTYVVKTTDQSNGCFVEDTLVVDWYLLSDIVDLEKTTVYTDSLLWGFGPYTYLWGPTSGFATQQANICPGDHWLEVTDRDGCTIDTFFTIDPITVVLNPANELIECDLENLDIELAVSPEGGTDPYTYLWTNGDTDSTTNLALSPGPLSVTIMDNNACTLDTIFRIAAMTPECVPNVFTPNNDQVNDFWNLEQAYLYSDTEITVWGRFGRKVFESVGYDVPWDGKTEKGNDVPDGVYYYHIELGNGYDPIQGTVTILR